MMNYRIFTLVGLTTFLTTSYPVVAATRYAKTKGLGSGTCSTWSAACALPFALSIAQTGDQVWVKAGTYGPVMLLPNGVKVIGGFAGSESAASQSNPLMNVTIIDGGGTSRCATSSDHSASTVVRGFTIRNGYEGGDDGGGALMVNNSSALFVQCVFENNQANYFGAAVAIRGASGPQFVNCDFHGNGTGEGTAVHPYGGGAVLLYSGTATFTNCLFYNNRAGDGGVLLNVFGAATFTNCTMANNAVKIGYGGAFLDPEGRVIVRNSILWGNTAPKGGAQIQNGSGIATTVSYSNVHSGWTGTGNLNSDPLFVNAAGGNYRLQDASPCKNTGDSTPFADTLPPDSGDLDWDANTNEPTPLDLDRLPRIRWLGPVDMGAYELFDEAPPGGDN